MSANNHPPFPFDNYSGDGDYGVLVGREFVVGETTFQFVRVRDGGWIVGEHVVSIHRGQWGYSHDEPTAYRQSTMLRGTAACTVGPNCNWLNGGPRYAYVVVRGPNPYAPSGTKDAASTDNPFVSTHYVKGMTHFHEGRTLEWRVASKECLEARAAAAERLSENLGGVTDVHRGVTANEKLVLAATERYWRVDRNGLTPIEKPSAPTKPAPPPRHPPKCDHCASPAVTYTMGHGLLCGACMAARFDRLPVVRRVLWKRIVAVLGAGAVAAASAAWWWL